MKSAVSHCRSGCRRWQWWQRSSPAPCKRWRSAWGQTLPSCQVRPCGLVWDIGRHPASGARGSSSIPFRPSGQTLDCTLQLEQDG